MPKYATFLLSARCPVCHCGNGHWCRDPQTGKTLITPHPERRKAALALACGVLRRPAA